MKKLLGLLLVITLVWPAAANADVLKNVNLIGEIETIASDVHHNTTPAWYNDNVNTRVLAGFSANLVEDVTANVLFQYVTNWNGALNGDRISGTAADYEENIEVANANVVLSNLFDCFEATIGRQFYGDEDSAVMYIGPNHYNAENFAYAPSIDAAKLTYSDDVKAFTFIAGKVPGAMNTINPNVNGTKLFGADFRMNLTDIVKLQTYIYDFQKVTAFDPDLASEDTQAGLYGAKLAFNPEAVLVSVEYARNFGGHRFIKEHHDTGYMWKVDAKVDINEFAVRGAFLYEKETFVSWGNYAPGLLIGHNLATLAFGGINNYSVDGIRMFNAGVDVKPFEKWTFALDGFTFQDRTGKDAATWEADLTAKYTHNEYVQLFAGLGYAKYHNTNGAVWKTAFDKDNFKWQLGMLINF